VGGAGPAGAGPYAWSPETPLPANEFPDRDTPAAARARRERRARARRARQARRRRPRPLTPRLPSKEINACFTGWPGGYLHFDVGVELPKGWVRTRLVGGYPTNRRCFPPRPDELEKAAGGGDLFTAVRDARTVAAKQQAQAALAQRKLAYQQYCAQPLPGDALSLRMVDAGCGKKPGPWACFARWPGGWLPYDHPEVQAHPDVWKGPTPYGTLTQECFGYRRDRLEAAGEWFINLVRRAPAPAVIQPAGAAPLAPASPPSPAPAPPSGPRTPGDGPDNCITIVRLYSSGCFKSPVDGKWYIIQGTA
jgi:hypothetical protein